MGNIKFGQLEYEMKIPVGINYHVREEDGSISVDTISVPLTEELYNMVNAYAKEIKATIVKEN